MIKLLKEVIVLLDRDVRKIFWLILLFLFSSLVNIVGIGLVGPYVGLLINPSETMALLEKLPVWSSLELQFDQIFLVLVFGFLLIGVFLIKAVVGILVERGIAAFGQWQEMSLRLRLMEIYQGLPYGVYLQRNSSEYVNAISKLTVQYSAGVLDPGLRLISDALIIIFVLVLLGFTNIMALGYLLILSGTFLFFYLYFVARRVTTFGRKASDAHGRMIQGIQEAMSGIKEIRILGKESFFHGIVAKGARIYAVNSLRTLVISAASRHLLELFAVASIVLLIAIVNNSSDNFTNALPTLAVFGVAAVRLVPLVSTVSKSFINLRFNRHAINLVYRDIALCRDEGNEINSRAGFVSNNERFKELILDQVEFQYSGTTTSVLQNVSLDIKAGEMIGVIGSSGAGKTTLIDVMLGLLEPRKGEIRYNNLAIQASLRQWWSHVAYLPQQTFLIDDSFRSNVALGILPDNIDNDQVTFALRQASLLNFVEQLPNGVNTMLGEGGMRISGGQRQRVALARAFYHRRDVLIMDEATSALDQETESAITRELVDLKGEITLIIITHKLSSLHFCDRIYRIEAGELTKFDGYSKLTGP